MNNCTQKWAGSKTVNILLFLQQCMSNNYISNILAKIKSPTEIDILVEVGLSEKIKPVIDMIEANTYLKPELSAKKIVKIHNSVKIIISETEKINLFVYNKEDFKNIALGKLM